MSKSMRRITLLLDEDIYQFLICYAQEISRAEVKPMNRCGVNEATRRLLKNQHTGRTLSEAMRRWLRKRMEVEMARESLMVETKPVHPVTLA
jgi:hypothetical protein